MTTQEIKNTSLEQALKHFETAEANLVKLEKLWEEMEALVPSGMVFGSSDIPVYDQKRDAYKVILPYLTPIDGWRPCSEILGLDEIAQCRLDYAELGEPMMEYEFEVSRSSPGSELQKYRYLLNEKRRKIVRMDVKDCFLKLDEVVHQINDKVKLKNDNGEGYHVEFEDWEKIREIFSKIDTLLGSYKRPSRWSDMSRHLSFAEPHDFMDIVNYDWPSIKTGLNSFIYDANEPIKSEIDDLGDLDDKTVHGPISRKLNWKNINDEEFERLIFSLFTSATEYENVQLLTKTNAPDRGRDLSADKINKDSFGIVNRERVIIQCKHWLDNTIGAKEIGGLITQMKLWEPPIVNRLIIVTTGRFSADAVALIERENHSDRALRIEMWAESHLETVLASKPNFIAEYKLRD